MIERSNHVHRSAAWFQLRLFAILCVTFLALSSNAQAADVSERKIPYAIVDTAQVRCYSDDREIAYPKAGAHWFGQDAQYGGNAPAYRDNGDGTITDRATGLTWMKVDSGALKAGKKKDGKLNWGEALAWAEGLKHAGH